MRLMHACEAELGHPGKHHACLRTAHRMMAMLLAGAVFSVVAARADDPNPAKAAVAAQKPAAQARKHTVIKAQPPLVQPAPAPQSELPKPPDWPANDRPVEAKVVWNSQGLRIDAANSSLQEILKEVSTATGAKVSGAATDMRVFGTYGPGPARDVLSQLLLGSGYNVLMIGDQGQGTPRQIVLSRKPSGPAPPPMNGGGSGDDDNSAEAQEEPQPQPAPELPQPPVNPPVPNGQPRTPQQILQEMQQRQQQLEQMQQQHNANPQNQ
jgi:hypothetical protein